MMMRANPVAVVVSQDHETKTFHMDRSEAWDAFEFWKKQPGVTSVSVYPMESWMEPVYEWDAPKSKA